MNTRSIITPLALILASISATALAQNALDAGNPNAPARPDRRASPVVQQNYATRGRALDSNFQVGSGGYNAPVANFQQDLALRNAVVTGNAAGGKAFRGDVGYSAADDFRGDTGSNDLFDFQRDSAYSGLATQNVRGLSALQFQLSESTGGQTSGIGGGLIVRRDSVGATAAEYAGSGTGGPALAVDPFSNIKGSLRSTSDFLLRNARFPKILGTMNQDDPSGALYMTASSLQGVKPLKVTNTVFSAQERPDLIGLPSSMQPRRPESTDPDNPDAPPEIPGIARPVAEPATAPLRILREDIKLRAGQIVSERYTDPVPGAKADEDAAAEAAKPAAPQESTSERIDRMVEELRRSFAERNSAEQSAVNDETDLERSLRRRDESQEAAEQPVPGEPLKPEDFDPLTPDEIIERSRLLLDSGERRLQSFLDAQGAKDLASWHMEKGEEALRAERWFDAEERFTAAIRAKPGDPMAAAARVHSQIGAGMFLSAATNLRNLLSAYPEMIAARFASDLFPQSRRLDALRILLRERLNQDPAVSRDAATILAYIGHQTSNTEDLKDAFAALDRIYEAAGTKPSSLEIAVRAAWLKQ